MLVALGALGIGTAVGVLTGLFGVGGGFLITPLLNVLLGVPMPIAVGTGAMQILGVSAAGLYRRRHEGLTDYKVAAVVFGGNYVGVRLGAALLEGLGGMGAVTINGREVVAVDLILLGIFTIVLAGIALWIWCDARRPGDEEECKGLFARIHCPPYTDFPTLTHPRLSIVVMSYFGLALGFLTGLLGIGGGVILVPALIYLVGMRAHQAAATSLALIALSSFVAVIVHAGAGNTNLALAVPLLIGGSVGVQFGATLCDRCDGQQLKRSFVLVVVGALLIVLGKLIGLVM
ncbi:MAG TPA: sulfite exporter TauE/SafE family protein [Chloroflexi bacterium]|jgi:uncharacterized membrane protein YfcA|nr:sulfite exporter TauE/SafE family protein [Chloroflexota bacterium]